MSKKIFQKTARSIIKLILPFLAKLFLKLRVNRRVINYLSDKSFNSNNYYDFSSIIQTLLKKEKIFSMDVGAQGGFNSELYFNSKYNKFFEPIMIEPIEEEYKKLKNNYKYVLNKGLWSSEEKKKIDGSGFGDPPRRFELFRKDQTPGYWDEKKIGRNKYVKFKIPTSNLA